MSEPARSSRSPLLWIGVQFLLVVLAVSRYDATSYVFRGTEAIDFFNWFWRYRLAGFLSFFDLLLVALVTLGAASLLASGRSTHRPFDMLVGGLLIAVAFAAAVRFLAREMEDTAQGFLFQLRNYLYFVATYFLFSRLSWAEHRRRHFAGLLAGLTVLTMVLSWWELGHTPPQFLLWKYGRYVNVRDLSDYLLIFFLQFWAAALLLEGLPRPWWQKAVVAAVLLHSLSGVYTGIGRGVILVYPVVFCYFAWYHGIFRRRWFAAAVASTALLGALGASYILLNAKRIRTESPLYIYLTFTSREAAVATRGRELTNFAGNLYYRGALLQGIGLGNKWYEFWPQPPDLGAFPRQEWDSRWHLGMHMPFLRLMLDFGLVGTAVVLTLFGAAFFSTMRALRSRGFDGPSKAFMLASWAVIGYQLSINNLASPKMNLFAGALLGAVAGMLHEATSVKQG